MSMHDMRLISVRFRIIMNVPLHHPRDLFPGCPLSNSSELHQAGVANVVIQTLLPHNLLEWQPITVDFGFRRGRSMAKATSWTLLTIYRPLLQKKRPLQRSRKDMARLPGHLDGRIVDQTCRCRCPTEYPPPPPHPPRCLQHQERLPRLSHILSPGQTTHLDSRATQQRAVMHVSNVLLTLPRLLSQACEEETVQSCLRISTGKHKSLHELHIAVQSPVEKRALKTSKRILFRCQWHRHPKVSIPL
jgi:hypothetical protein